MSLLPIVEYPEPGLRRSSIAVTEFDRELSALVDDLFDTLRESGGIGLSAPQVGQNLRISIVHVADDEYGPRVYVNPRLLAKSAPGFVEESCLSVPGIVGSVIRPTQIRVAAQDLDGREFEVDLGGMHAVCLQHEMEHLDGKLFIDRLWWLRRLWVKHQLDRRARFALPGLSQDESKPQADY